jgi:hypothetical protein
MFADSKSDPEERSPPEKGDEDLHGAEGYSEYDENEDDSADESEIDEIEQQSDEESDQDGEEELDEQEVQEDSSDAEEGEHDSEDAEEVEEGNKEEDGIEDVEEAESFFNRIAGLDNSMFGDIRLNNEALFAITGPVRKIREEVSGKTNREIADAMSALARKTVFVDALSELSKVYKVYSSVKLNAHGSDKDESLLVETIRSALRKFMRPVPNRQSMLLTLSIQFISASSGKKLQQLLCCRRQNTSKIHNAFNYLYRPMEMEEMSLYAYYCCETKFIKISEAKKLAIDYFEYTEQHFFHRIEAVVYQTAAAVPVFSWNWICST